MRWKKFFKGCWILSCSRTNTLALHIGQEKQNFSGKRSSWHCCHPWHHSRWNHLMLDTLGIIIGFHDFSWLNSHSTTVFQIQKCIDRHSRRIASVASVLPGLGRASGWFNYWQSNGLHVILHKKMQHLKENVHVQFARRTKMSGYRPGRFPRWWWPTKHIVLISNWESKMWEGDAS